MKFSVIILFSFVMLLLAACITSGVNQSDSGNQSDSNQTKISLVVNVSPQENLMNLAFDAREYALENGKDKAIAEYSKPSGLFNRNGSYVIAYGMDGTLLADKTRPGDVGTLFIKDDHDSGQVRLMRDIASTGSGLYTDPTTGKFWFISDIDGSWWICSANENIKGQ